MGVDGRGSAGREFTVLRLIWAAMVVSVIIYVAVARFVVSALDFRGTALVGILLYVFIGVSLGLLAAQLFVRSSLSDERLFPILLKASEAGVPSGSGDDGEDRRLLQQRTSKSVVVWALGEAPAIFGLVLTFLSGDLRYAAGFGLYSILNLVRFRPSRPDFEEQLRRWKQHLSVRGPAAGA